jgi:hypothetical protein
MGTPITPPRDAITARLYRGPESSSQPAGDNVFVDFEPMNPDARRQKGRENVVSSLNVAIETLNLAKEVASITPAKVVFGSVGIILTMIKVSFFPFCLR